jgi:predicted ATPase
MVFLRSIRLGGLLSFPPDSAAIELTPLNVLIGPNGSGKTNLIEAVELLHAAPTAFAAAILDGGGIQEWLWKGDKNHGPATIEAIVQGTKAVPDLRYQLTFTAAGQRTEVIDEATSRELLPWPLSPHRTAC